jgi:protein TonB
MYRPVPTFRERAGPLAAVVLVHAAIGYALLNLSGAGRELAERADLAVFDVILPVPPVEPPPPPPPPAAVAEQRRQEKAKPKDEGAAAPENIRSEASPVVAPKPRIELPAPSPVVAAVTPAQGAGATQGAGDTPGPGTGAGGTGQGTGSGGAGSGRGGGGAGGGTPSRPAVIESTKLTSRDYPPAAIRAWPRGGRVFVAVRVQLDGRATDCKINRSSGNPGIDADTCRLVMERVRFVPARDEQGRPYVDWYGYMQQPAGRW